MANGLSYYFDLIKEKLSDKNDDEVLFFRGLADVIYDLKPSVSHSLKDENDLYNEIHVEYPEEFKKNEHLSNLVKMQHYGSCTRLLDLSRNPLIALYFAAEQSPQADGKVCVIKVPKEKVMPHTSDKGLMLSCIPALRKDVREGIKDFCKKHKGEITDQDVRYNAAMRKLLHEIRSEFPAFETAIIGQDLLDCHFVSAYKDNERMKIQDGAFVVYGLDEDANERYMKEHTEMIRIDKDDKKELLQDLKFCGIDSACVYPDLERRARYFIGKRIEWVEI